MNNKYKSPGLGGVGHIEVIVKNLSECTDFYSKKLGWPIIEKQDTFVDFQVDGVPFSLLFDDSISDDNAIKKSTVLLLIVQDCDDSFALLSSRGVKFLTNPENKPWGKVAEFEDPEGNRWQLIDKNPLRSPESSEFTDKVIQCLVAKGYTYSFVPENSTINNLFLIQTDLTLSSSATLVLCWDNSISELTQVQIKYLNELLDTTINYQIDAALLITPETIPNHLENNLYPKLKILSFSDLLNNLINIERYITTLLREIERDSERILDYYVDLEAREFFSKEKSDHIYSPIDNFVDDWLSRSDGNLLSIIGEYGTGKTSFTKYYAHKLANLNLNELGVVRIPILINLRNYSKSLSFEQLITDLLINHYGIREASYQVFEIMLEYGLFVLLLDGFDEMARKVDFNTTISNFEEINRLAKIPRSKIILTCREEFFRTEERVTELLRLHEREEYRILHLEPFTDAKIKEYLNRRLESADKSSHYWQRIQGLYDLHSLAQRPVLLNQIIHHLPDLPPDEPIQSIDLYEMSLQTEVLRRSIGNTLINRDDRIMLMQLLALWMIRNHQDEIHFSKVADEINLKKYFSLGTKRDIEYYLHDFLTCSLMSRSPDGNYRFSHRSFLEYFVTRHITYEIKENYPDQIKWFCLSDVEQEFHTIRSFLTQYDISPDTLFAWIESTKNARFEKVGYLGGNSITILNWLDKVDFTGRDFRRTVLRGADLSRANFTNSNFSNADMQGSNMYGTVLIGVNASGADWTDTVITDMDKVRTLSWSKDGNYLATAGIDSFIRVWNTKLGTEEYLLRGHIGTIWSLDFSLTGDFLISAGSDSTIRVWDIHKQQQKYCLQGHQGTVFVARIDAKNKYIFSGDKEGFVQLWNFETGELESKWLISKGKRLKSLSIGTENNILITGTNDNIIRCWNIDERNNYLSINVHTDDWTPAVALSPDEKIIAGTLNKNGDIGIWDVLTGELLSILHGHSDFVQYLEFSKHSGLLVSCSEDGTAQIWDTNNWKKLVVLTGHSKCVMCSRFDNQGKYIATVSSDSTARIWDSRLNSTDFGTTLFELEMRLQYDDLIISSVKGVNNIIRREEPGFHAPTQTLRDWLIQRGARE